MIPNSVYNASAVLTKTETEQRMAQLSPSILFFFIQVKTHYIGKGKIMFYCQNPKPKPKRNSTQLNSKQLKSNFVEVRHSSHLEQIFPSCAAPPPHTNF